MKSAKSRVAATLIGGAACLAAPHAGAATVGFDDSAADGSVTLSACDFDNGAFVAGVLLGTCGKGYGGSTTLSASSGKIIFSGGWVDNRRSGTGTRTIYLVKAATPKVISDIFTYSWVPSSVAASTNILAEFTSDANGTLGTLPAGVSATDVFVEDGQPVTFTLPLPNGRIQADSALPEPSNVAPAGLALTITITLGQRKR